MSSVAKKPSHGIHGPMDQWRKTIFYGYFLERNCYITVISFPYHDQFHRFPMFSSKKGQQRSENGETMDNKGLLSEWMLNARSATPIPTVRWCRIMRIFPRATNIIDNGLNYCNGIYYTAMEYIIIYLIYKKTKKKTNLRISRTCFPPTLGHWGLCCWAKTTLKNGSHRQVMPGPSNQASTSSNQIPTCENSWKQLSLLTSWNLAFLLDLFLLGPFPGRISLA